MEYSSSVNGTTCELNLKGEFTFLDHGSIRELLSAEAESAITKYIINLNGLSQIDSAGLGMLLLLNERFTENGKSMELAKAGGQVHRMLEISKFSELVTITS